MRVNRQELLQQLEAVSPGLATREIIEQSSCFVFRGGMVITYNDEVACSIKCGLDIEGAVTAKPLLDLLGKLQEEELDIEAAKGELIVKGRHKEARPRMENEVLLPVDGVETATNWKPLHPDFCEAISLVVQCAGKEATQFQLTCVHLHTDYVEACDNFQMARFPVPTGVRRPVLVRATALRNVPGLGVTEFSETRGWCHFRNPAGLTMSCRRETEEYPTDSLTQVMESKGTPITLPGGLAEAVEKAEIFSSENTENNNVYVVLKPGRLQIKGQGSKGWYRETKKIAYDGDPISFMIAPKLLVELEKRHKDCVVAPTPGNPDSAGLLKVEGGKFNYATCLGVVPAEEAEAIA